MIRLHGRSPSEEMLQTLTADDMVSERERVGDRRFRNGASRPLARLRPPLELGADIGRTPEGQAVG